MNLNQVQVFCAVAKHLSFSMAAEELFITQPAVSQQVKALERQLNVKLFERVGHKLFLTESGEAVLTHCQAMLTARAEMEQTLAMLRGSGRGRLALGANTTGGMYVAPAIVRAFRDLSPEVEATLQIETTNRILDRVMQNMIDVAIVTGPVEDGRFAIRDLCEDEVHLIVSPSHPFAGRASVSPAEVAAEDFAVPEPGLADPHAHRAGLPRPGPPAPGDDAAAGHGGGQEGGGGQPGRGHGLPLLGRPGSWPSACWPGSPSTGWSSIGPSTSCTARGSTSPRWPGDSWPSPPSTSPRSAT